MEIKLDLNDILGDENGVETLQESVRRQVIESLVRTVQQGVSATIKTEVAKTVQDTLKTELVSRMPSIIDDVLTSEYTPVDRYGDRNKVTTFRSELIKSINENMVYKKSQYSSNENPFTQAVNAVVSENVAEFKKEFAKLVTAQFIAEAMAYATAEMSKRLGLSK